MKIEKIIGIITILGGILFFIMLFSNIQALYFTSNYNHLNLEINNTKQFYSYFEWFLYGIWGVFAGYFLFKEKYIGWVLASSFWLESIIRRILTIILNLEILNLQFLLLTFFTIVILVPLLSNSFLTKYNVTRKSWLLVITIISLMIFLTKIY